MSPESLKIVANVIIALALLVLVGLQAVTLEQALTGIALVLVPSGGPELVARIREAFAKIAKKEPNGDAASKRSGTPPLLALAFIFLVVRHLVACAALFPPSGAEPASAPACAAKELTVDECGAEYSKALAICSAKAKTRDESEACEERLRKAHGRPPLDAGAEGGAR